MREEIAAVQHTIWSHWMKYLFSVSDTDSGCETIPVDEANRWKRQVNIPYSELTEKKKKFSRDQADKVIMALKKARLV